MKEQIKEFVKNQPALMKWYRKLKSGSVGKPSITKSVKGSGNKLQFDNSALFVNCNLTIEGNNNEIIIKDTTMFNNVTFYIYGDNNRIFISKGVTFDEGGSLWVEDHHCEIHLGERTSYRNVSIAVTEPYSKVIIGSDGLFAYDVDIRTGDSHSIIDMTTNKRINYAKDIQIGDHVWIASHVSILKGVNIPSNTIIASRSLVTKSFTREYTLIGGIPATVKKENIKWVTERIYDADR